MDMWQNEDDRNFREPTGKIRRFFYIWKSNAGAMIPMSILYSLMRVALIPAGLASAGMTEVAGDLVRLQHYYGITEFFAAIKKCWRKALVVGILDVLLTVVILLAGWFYLSSSGIMGALGLGCFLLTMMTYSFMKYYIWPQIVLFDLPLTDVYKNAFIFAFINMKYNLLIGLISLVCYAAAALLLIYVPYMFTLALVLVAAVCFFPGFKHLLVQYCVYPCIRERMIDPYYAENPDQDLEEREKLGL